MELGGPYRRPGRRFTSVRTSGFGTVYVSLGLPPASERDEPDTASATRYRARRPGQWSE